MMIRAQVNDNSDYARLIFKPATYIQDYFSLYRGWEMFAPNPVRVNRYVDALIEYPDGASEVFKFPIPESHWARYFRGGERLRKFADSGLIGDGNPKLMRDAARWILKQKGENDPGRIPSKITLRNNWQQIPRLDQGFLRHRERSSYDWNIENLFTYEVL